MEFEFNCEQVTKADKSGYAVFDSTSLAGLPKKSYEYIESLVDVMGKFSAKAQKLSSPITSFKRMQMNTDKQKIYFFSQKKKCYGFLKTGHRKLFVSTEYGDIKEINPLCVLDFYVTEEVQRQGIGKRLFDLMLRDSGSRPEKIAYDRPSDKLLKFLSKHFGLKRYLPQNNNFVVFSQYFTSAFTKPHVEKVEDEDAKSMYSSKPSYKVTYQKGGKKHYTGGPNVVNQDYIKNLIGSCSGEKEKIRRMPVNEESKDGWSQMVEMEEDTYKPKHSSKLKESRNPIFGDSLSSNDIPKSTDDKENVPSGVDLDRLIQQKEAELQEVMERLSVSSKQSDRKEYYEKAVPRKSNLKLPPNREFEENRHPIQHPPLVIEKKEPDVTHGHSSLPYYNHKSESYTASGMRRAQFHSGAPWATD
jgi:GNAT superfamily N-acetyltransferase